MNSDPFHKTITSETLERDRQRREKERATLAKKYDAAADVLDDESSQHREAVWLLREEAKRWRL